MVKVNGITCRTLQDTGAGSSYISSTSGCELKKLPIRTDYTRETMMHTTNTLTDIYNMEIANTKANFTISKEVSQVISMPNPHNKDIIQAYTHLQGVQMEDNDNKEFLPVHLEHQNMPKSKQKRTSKLGKKENKSLSIPVLNGSSLQETRREPAIVLY